MITYEENSAIIDLNKRNERRLMTKTKGFWVLCLRRDCNGVLWQDAVIMQEYHMG